MVLYNKHMRFMRLLVSSKLRAATVSGIMMVAVTVMLLFTVPTSAGQLQNRSLTLADATQGASTEYDFGFEVTTGSNVGSIRFQFCSDTPIADYECAIPWGMDTTSSVLASESGMTGFSYIPGANKNIILLSREVTEGEPGLVRFVFDGIVNPAANGSYYVRIQTYATNDGTGPHTDFGGLSFMINDAINVSTKVPPYLLMCGGVTIKSFDCATASGNYISFGSLSADTAKTSKTELVLATNDEDGYSVFVSGTTMASGVDVIPALASAEVSRPGVNQFGINLSANKSPEIGAEVIGPGTGSPTTDYNIADRFKYVSGEQIITASGVNDYRKYTISYLVNISRSQPVGVYVATLTYIAVGNF